MQQTMKGTQQKQAKGVSQEVVGVVGKLLILWNIRRWIIRVHNAQLMLKHQETYIQKSNYYPIMNFFYQKA